MKNLATQKSMLAKLLATENIDVQHSDIPTAYFNLETRTLMLPIWENMDGDLYDLLTGHEVGHALETPLEGWHNSTHAEDGKYREKFKSFLNVLEDVRIEKKIKRRYPGLTKSFVNAYKGLYERDFFGVANIGPLDQLNLIDRINLHAKIGANLIVPFTDEEREFVKEAFATETWDQVVELAERIFSHVKETESNKINSEDDLQSLIEGLKEMANQQEDNSANQQEDNSSAPQPQEFQNELPDQDDQDKIEQDASSTTSSATGQDEDQEEGAADSDESDREEYEHEFNPESVTDRMFRSNEHQLVNTSGLVRIHNLPEPLIKNIVADNKKFFANFKNVIMDANNNSYDDVVKHSLTKFNSNNKKYINHLLKEFEMRKQASAYARTHVARTGELDMNVIHKYKFSNDLFKKVSVVGKGKSHGMILFLDMSGSMERIFRNTVEQLMITVAFCKLANIPFDIYGFTNHPKVAYMFNTEAPTFQTDPNGLFIDEGSDFRMIHLISSNFDRNQYSDAWGMLAIVSQMYGYMKPDDRYYGAFDYQTWKNAGFGLKSTPYLETLLASVPLIQAFKQKHMKDIVNVIYLTDGEGSSGFSWDGTADQNLPNRGYYKIKRYAVHKKSKKRTEIFYSYHNGHTQANITNMVREITGCKHIGFYLCNQRYFSDMVNSSNLSSSEMKIARQNKVVCRSNLGYDKYFYAISSDANITDEMEGADDGKPMTKTQLASAFKKMQKNKSSNRYLVSRFAEEIAA